MYKHQYNSPVVEIINAHRVVVIIASLVMTAAEISYDRENMASILLSYLVFSSA